MITRQIIPGIFPKLGNREKEKKYFSLRSEFYRNKIVRYLLINYYSPRRKINVSATKEKKKRSYNYLIFVGMKKKAKFLFRRLLNNLNVAIYITGGEFVTDDNRINIGFYDIGTFIDRRQSKTCDLQL